MKLLFRNPYANLPDSDKSRITVDISTSDYHFIACMRPGIGTITGAVGMLWQKLCNELKQRGITDVSRLEDFEQFVSNIKLIDGRSDRVRGLYDGSTSGPVPEADAPNDGARVEGLRPADTREEAELPGVEKQRSREKHSKKGARRTAEKDRPQ